MKKYILIICVLFLSLMSFSQNSKGKNDILIEKYFNEYISEATDRGYDVKQDLMDNIKIIKIVTTPISTELGLKLAETNLSTKEIIISDVVEVDCLILKVILYRELSYVLGVPYDEGDGVIMRRNKGFGYSYAGFINSDIMKIELDEVFRQIAQ